MNVVAVAREGERYVFLFDDDPRSGPALRRLIGRYASDPQLSFSWYDAVVVALKVADTTPRADTPPRAGRP